ncbi:MAG: hypothetical protein DDT19_01013 [Syntrophomonadaceae bacterium]|nr:hypothetical protein [Bacillota bacterium]
MEKDKKNKKEMKNKNSKLKQNCNISKVTDNVEFANKPFNDANKKKSNRDENNKKLMVAKPKAERPTFRFWQLKHYMRIGSNADFYWPFI